MIRAYAPAYIWKYFIIQTIYLSDILANIKRENISICYDYDIDRNQLINHATTITILKSNANIMQQHKQWCSPITNQCTCCQSVSYLIQSLVIPWKWFLLIIVVLYIIHTLCGILILSLIVIVVLALGEGTHDRMLMIWMDFVRHSPNFKILEQSQSSPQL